MQQPKGCRENDSRSRCGTNSSGLLRAHAKHSATTSGLVLVGFATGLCASMVEKWMAQRQSGEFGGGRVIVAAGCRPHAV